MTAENAGADRDERLKIYLMYVDSAQQITARRHEANRYYISAIAAVSVTYSYALTQLKDVGALHLMVALAGAAICLVWRASLSRFRRINAGKFKVIQEIETRLTEKPFTREQELDGAKDRRWGPNSFASLEAVLATGGFLAAMFVALVHAFKVLGI